MNYDEKSGIGAYSVGTLTINGGTISYGTSVTVGPLRWIVRVESKFGENPVYARQMIIFDGEEASGIETIDNGQLTIDSSWFTLDGRKLSQKPSRAGVYINKGVKRLSNNWSLRSKSYKI